MNSDTACAFSEGGPGLNLGEQSGDNSTLGTKNIRLYQYHSFTPFCIPISRIT